MKKIIVSVIAILFLCNVQAQSIDKGDITWGVSLGTGGNLLNNKVGDNEFAFNFNLGAYIQYAVFDNIALTCNPQYSPLYIMNIDYDGFMHYVDIPLTFGYQGDRGSIALGLQYSLNAGNSIDFYSKDKLNYLSTFLEFSYRGGTIYNLLSDNSTCIFRIGLGLNRIKYAPTMDIYNESRPVFFQVIYRWNLSEIFSSSNHRRR